MPSNVRKPCLSGTYFALSKATLIEYLNITNDWNDVMKIYVTGSMTTIVVVLVAALSLGPILSTNQQRLSRLPKAKMWNAGELYILRISVTDIIWEK
jgi:hypothetical protein